MTVYYDTVFVFLPVSLLGLSGLLFALGVLLVSALTLGGLVATGLTAHGLFVNDPVPASSTTEQAETARESAD